MAVMPEMVVDVVVDVVHREAIERISVAPPGSVVFIEVADPSVTEAIAQALRRLPPTGRPPKAIIFLGPGSRAEVQRHLLPALWMLVRWAWRGWRSGR